MDRAERLIAKAERTAEQRDLHAGDPLRKLAAKPVRSTVDLPAGQHARLKAWCGETAVELGQARVTTQDVLRALVSRLLTDETLAETIRNDLGAAGSSEW
jgi:hypothetical protein